MIERVCRRRLASATYHPSSHLEEHVSSQEELAEQKIVVFSDSHTPNQDDVCRHVASKQSTGLPFFVMSLQRLIENINEWRSRMPRVSAFYAMRCNADPVLCKMLAEQKDFGFEVSDHSLLDTALDLVPSHRILYSNPLLTRRTLCDIQKKQVGMLVIETERDLFNAIAYAPDIPLLLRVCVLTTLRCQSSDVATLFGCPFNEARDLLLTACELRAKVVGISFNMGSDNHEPSLYHKAIRSANELLVQAREMGLHLDTVSLGGGFCGDEKQRFAEVADVIDCSISEFFPSSVRVIATPGRYFAGPAFNLCTTVIAKRVTEASHITNDDFDSGSGYIYQTNEGIYGSFGCRLVENCEPKCRPLDDLPHHHGLYYTTVLGPNVNGTDVAQPLALLPQLAVGEWLIWDNMGAYSMPFEADEPGLPVYYFDSRKSWDSRVAEKKALHRTSSDSDMSVKLGSDGGSEHSSDCEEDVAYECDYEEGEDDFPSLPPIFYRDFRHGSSF